MKVRNIDSSLVLGCLGGDGGKIPDAHPIVGRRSQGEDPADAQHPSMTGLAQHGYGLEPAKYLFYPLASSLAQQVTGVTAGAPVDRAHRLLRHVRRDPMLAQLAHELPGVVTFLTVKIETIQATDCMVMRLIGQLEAEYLPKLKALIEAAPGGIAFEMDELTLVDVHAVRFLMDCEAHGIELRKCSAYIRKWIAREREAVK